MRFYCITIIHIILFSSKLLSYFSTALPLLPYCVKIYKRTLIPHSRRPQGRVQNLLAQKQKVPQSYSLLIPTREKGEGAPNLIFTPTHHAHHFLLPSRLQDPREGSSLFVQLATWAPLNVSTLGWAGLRFLGFPLSGPASSPSSSDHGCAICQAIPL